MKVQTALRVDKLLLARFKVLCQGKRLRVGEAVQRRAEELRLRSALAELRGFIKAVDGSDEWFVSDKDGRCASTVRSTGSPVTWRSLDCWAVSTAFIRLMYRTEF